MSASPRCALALLVALLGASTARADDTAAPAAGARLRFGMWDADGWYHEGYFQGDQRLGRDAFLIAAGRRDVVDRVKNRRLLRLGMAGAGALLGVASFVYVATRPSCNDVLDQPGPGDEHQDCLDARGRRLTLGTVATIGGAGLVIGALTLGHLRPSRAELRAIARTHNARQAKGTAVVLTPTLSPRSAGLSVSLSF